MRKPRRSVLTVPRLPLAVAFSVLVPVGFQLAFGWMLEMILHAPSGDPLANWYWPLAFVSLGVSSACGFWLMARRWTRRAKLIAAVVYFPLMGPLLTWTETSLFYQLFGR